MKQNISLLLMVLLIILFFPYCTKNPIKKYCAISEKEELPQSNSLYENWYITHRPEDIKKILDKTKVFYFKGSNEMKIIEEMLKQGYCPATLDEGMAYVEGQVTIVKINPLPEDALNCLGEVRRFIYFYHIGVIKLYFSKEEGPFMGFYTATPFGPYYLGIRR